MGKGLAAMVGGGRLGVEKGLGSRELGSGRLVGWRTPGSLVERGGWRARSFHRTQSTWSRWRGRVALRGLCAHGFGIGGISGCAWCLGGGTCGGRVGANLLCRSRRLCQSSGGIGICLGHTGRGSRRASSRFCQFWLWSIVRTRWSSGRGPRVCARCCVWPRW